MNSPCQLGGESVLNVCEFLLSIVVIQIDFRVSGFQIAAYVEIKHSRLPLRGFLSLYCVLCRSLYDKCKGLNIKTFRNKLDL